MAFTPPARPTIPAAFTKPAATTPKAGREGLRVRLQPIPGVTDRHLMTTSGFTFQCPPLEEFGTDYAFAHSDYDTIKAGQFSRRGGRQLRSVAFDTLLVDQGSFSILDREIEIEDHAHRLIKICESGSPFLLTVAHRMPPHGYRNWHQTLAGPELQMEATLRTLKVAEKAGEGDARYLNVSFTEYREPFARADTKRHGQSRNFKHFPRTVLLYRNGVARDKSTGQTINKPPQFPVTLHSLSRFYYHSPSLWKQIAHYNRNRIFNWGANDQLIDYFAQARHTKKWPVKLTIPAPPDYHDAQPTAVVGPRGGSGLGHGILA